MKYSVIPFYFFNELPHRRTTILSKNIASHPAAYYDGRKTLMSVIIQQRTTPIEATACKSQIDCRHEIQYNVGPIHTGTWLLTGDEVE